MYKAIVPPFLILVLFSLLLLQTQHNSKPYQLHPVDTLSSGSTGTTNDTLRVILDNNTFPEGNSSCTFRLIREYIKHHKTYPSGGKWYLDDDPPYYQPKLCKFKQRLFNKNDVASCLLNADVKSVMTIGDSNAGRNFMALREFPGRCPQTRVENLGNKRFLPNASYFQMDQYSNEEWIQFLRIHYRFCSGCAGMQHECTLPRGQGKGKDPGEEPGLLKLEHLPMTMILDDTMQIHVPNHEYAGLHIRDLWALTSQEVTFRYFLKDRYPDVFLVYLPFNHAKHFPAERVRMDIEFFRSLVHLYFPSTTKVVYMPTFSEFETKRRNPIWINKTFDGMLAAEKINTLNRVLSDVLRDDLVNDSSNTFGFFDLFDMSKSLEAWSLDGVHMSTEWYRVVMSMFWETFCNSVAEDAF